MDQGLVGKGECKSDARVSYAILTEDGLSKLRDAAPGHVESIERRLGAALDPDELEVLTKLLRRLNEVTVEGDHCTPD
jgi:DNA-binding MarR family transcriptional regulator